MEEEKRICPYCLRELPLSSFNKLRDTYRHCCKDCEGMAKGRPPIIEKLPDGYKRCSKCGFIMRYDKFPLAKKGHGYLSTCKQCREKSKWYKRTPNKEWEKRKPEREVSIPIDQMHDRVIKGSINGINAKLAACRQREAEEQAIREFRKEETEKFRKQGAPHGVDTPCRLCTRFLTNSCPDIVCAILSAGMECRYFKRINPEKS
ncbi:hypothetical protein EVA_01900 [gut metagenome]|uniref:Uncharacterized protein n=1 Tax=gut metagenome TaxID=749906 RepID=J9GP77_9ZZZZ